LKTIGIAGPQLKKADQSDRPFSNPTNPKKEIGSWTIPKRRKRFGSFSISKNPKWAAPRWILQRVKAAIKAGKINQSNLALTTGAVALDHLAGICGDSWADHFGMLKYDGNDVLVTEPYAASVSERTFNQLSKVAKILDAAYLVSAKSWHFPGRTLRIYVMENSKISVKIRSSENTPGKDLEIIQLV
jgi:hypothetical protein